MIDLHQAVRDWFERGDPIALATVVGTWGSSPRQTGAKMVVNERSEIAGSVSGGCVEGAVVQEALHVLAGADPRLLEFGVSDETAWSVGLSCGGKITVFVERLRSDWWNVLDEGRKSDSTLACVTRLEGAAKGSKMIVTADSQVAWSDLDCDDALKPRIIAAAVGAMQRRESSRAAIGGADVLIDLQLPRPRLLIVGGAHVAQSLHRLAAEIGFRTILIDPRKAFATPERFPGAEAIFHEYPQQVLPVIGLDRDTYLAVLTHDPKIDDQALLLALPSAAPYVGILSSRKTHQKRLARLLEAGADPDLLDRIRTPIGLDIGARTPEEIALAIMAEIIQCRRRPNP